MPPKTPNTPAYLLSEQARQIVARMDGDLPWDDGLWPEVLDAPAGVDPREISEWLAQCDSAIERRYYVAARLASELAQARAEAARFRERAQRLEHAIEGVKAPALALMIARRELGEVDEEGKVRVRTSSGVSAWLIATERCSGPERAEDWPPAFQRITVEPDRAGAKAAILAYRDAEAAGLAPPVTRELLDLAAAGVAIQCVESIGWR